MEISREFQGMLADPNVSDDEIMACIARESVGADACKAHDIIALVDKYHKQRPNLSLKILHAGFC